MGRKLETVTKEQLELMQEDPKRFWQNVTEIGYHAFENCTSLKEITIPEGVAEIGWYAFADCTSLESVTGLEGVEYIGERAFKGCTSLKSIHIPESVTEIGERAFSECTSLESIHIPEGVTEIGYFAFYGCTSLGTVTGLEGVTKINLGAFYGCESLENIHIPEGVTEIGEGAFGGCTSLKEITIPESVTEIGGGAFNGCTSLKEITIPEGVKEIGEYAFKGCTSLKEITIPEGVKEIGENAFKGTKCRVNIKDGDKTYVVPSFVFDFASLEEVKALCNSGANGKFFVLIKEQMEKDGNANNAMRLLKLAKMMGVLEPSSKKAKLKDKDVAVSGIAQKVFEIMLKTHNINLSGLSFDSKEKYEFSPAFLEFVLNPKNRTDLAKNIEKLPQVMKWFKSREGMSVAEGAEKNRFKIHKYERSEHGEYVETWNDPTVASIVNDMKKVSTFE